MFNNSDSDNDRKDGHMHSGRVFREVHLVKLLRRTTGRMVSIVEKKHN
jgi:hypothetical protein